MIRWVWWTPLLYFHTLQLVFRDLIRERELKYTFIDCAWWYVRIMHACIICKCDIWYQGIFPESVTILRRGFQASLSWKLALCTELATLKTPLLTYVMLENSSCASLSTSVLWTSMSLFMLLSTKGAGHRRAGSGQEDYHVIQKRGSCNVDENWNASRPSGRFSVRGDNTIKNAMKEEYGGALDAKESSFLLMSLQGLITRSSSRSSLSSLLNIICKIHCELTLCVWEEGG